MELVLADRVKFLNAEPRCACVLLLDTSSSMAGASINALNQGLQVFKKELQGDQLASVRVEVAIITFNSSVQVAQEFKTAKDFQPPTLSTNGLTSMGEGILRALEMIEIEKQKYRSVGIMTFRPWIFMITDGLPTDDVTLATQCIRDAEANKHVCFFAVGVGDGVDMDILSNIAVRQPLKLQGLNFSQMFQWLSNSLGSGGVSGSVAGSDEQVALPSPAGWGAV